MNMRYPAMLSIFAAAAIAVACNSDAPLAGQGTKTQYQLQIDSVTWYDDNGNSGDFPTKVSIKGQASNNTYISVWVSDVTSGKTVTGAISGGATADPTIAVIEPDGIFDSYVGALKVGATTITATYLNQNTGAVVTAPNAVTVNIVP